MNPFFENNLYFYFSRENRRFRFRDGREIQEGATHSVDGPIILCDNGLHASPTPFEALHYAPGSILWVVSLSGDVIVGDDKIAARERTYICSLDLTDYLREFARKQALSCAHRIRPYCSSNDYDAIMCFLSTGKRRKAAWSAESAARSAESAAAHEFNDDVFTLLKDKLL